MAFADTTGLEHTDGYGLLPQAARFSKEESEAIFQTGKQACQSDCVSPFAEKLGENNHVAAYSNCKSSCITPEYTFMDVATKAMSVHTQDPQKAGLHYVGVTYQCVEYARRWWMSNEGITFGDVDGAADIIYLTEVEAIASDKKYPMGRSINGTAQRPPAKGDLVVYYPNRKDPKWRFGVSVHAL
ncbi:hypothetical protein [Thiothrix nivea]|uniref:hypothetical protein n=1 Tax=Thiothrix nivea TaxID=1031 RepID=UPI0012B69A38|nr:hypothetical protein [Thiothrix nivea]